MWTLSGKEGAYNDWSFALTSATFQPGIYKQELCYDVDFCNNN